MCKQLENDSTAWIGHKLSDGRSAEEIEHYLKEVIEIEKKYM